MESLISVGLLLECLDLAGLLTPDLRHGGCGDRGGEGGLEPGPGHGGRGGDRGLRREPPGEVGGDWGWGRSSLTKLGPGPDIRQLNKNMLLVNILLPE